MGTVGCGPCVLDESEFRPVPNVLIFRSGMDKGGGGTTPLCVEEKLLLVEMLENCVVDGAEGDAVVPADEEDGEDTDCEDAEEGEAGLAV